MAELILAIVRGPEPYFHSDGVLYAPGSVVEVAASLVSAEPFREETVKIKQDNGETVERTIKRKVKFRPFSISSASGEGVQVNDNLNASDFLKQGVEEIATAIGSGAVDPHLGAIEQAEISGKGRKGVKEAIVDRMAVLQRG